MTKPKPITEAEFFEDDKNPIVVLCLNARETLMLVEFFRMGVLTTKQLSERPLPPDVALILEDITSKLLNAVQVAKAEAK